MTRLTTAGELGDRLGVDPREISQVLYRLPALREMCPVVGVSRIIPEEAIPLIRAELVRLGKLPSEEVSGAQQGQ
jgi:hypothetical protein